MTFYEELGVPPDASLDTIREAYRNVARLLHPDAQTNPVLKESAEVQMKRINQVYETLAEPERRRRYDQELHAGTPDRPETIIVQTPLPPDQLRHGRRGTVVWLAATGVCAIFIIWLATRESSAPAVYPQTWAGQGTRARVDAVPTPSALRRAAKAILPVANVDRQRDGEIARLREELAAANADRERLVRQVAAMEAERKFQPPPSGPQRQIHVPPPVSLQTAPLPPPEISIPSVAVALPAPPAAQPAKWVGVWAYNQARAENKTKALIPPEFIETVIQEDSGRAKVWIRGQYHARFKVADARISPAVDFHFEGLVSGTFGRLPWTGPDGARGEVQLRLISDTALEIVWTASDLGKSMGLASGTAILSRKN